MSQHDVAGAPLAIVGMACRFPHVIERLEFGRMLFLGRQDRRFVFEFWLLGDVGAVLFHCRGCRFVEVRRPA